MPEINHKRLDESIGETIRSFRAVEHHGETHVPLTGPKLLRMYEEPQVGVAQGAIFTFDAGERPQVVMVIEKLGGRLRVRLARMTSERVEVFHNDNMFSDLENNYIEQML